MDIEIISKIYLPSVMSLFLAYIAYQQLSTNKKKLKLDLYHKRFDIYSVALKFYSEVVVSKITQETHRDFIEAKNASSFLFSKDPSIPELLNEMHFRSFKISGFTDLKSVPVSNPEAFQKMHNDTMDTQSWFDRAIEDLRVKMGNHLNL